MQKEEIFAQYLQGVPMTTAQLGKVTADATGLVVLGLAGMEIVPAAAALFTVVWMFFRMIEAGIRVYCMLFSKKHDRREDDTTNE